LYLLFSRQPDFFDGERVPAVIHFAKDSTGKEKPFAVFSIGKEEKKADASYLFRNYKEGDKVEVIYEASQPKYATVYSWWGYGITWGELVGSIVLLIVAFQAAVQITKHPDPQAIIDQEEKLPKRRKYSN
jgi:hypothetical protein